MDGVNRPAVWIDDAHPIFRRGMAACLQGSGFRVAGESAALTPMPDLAGVALLVFEASTSSLRQVLRLTAPVRLVATVAEMNEADLCRLFEAGVDAVLPRSALTAPVLTSTVRAALDGVATLPSEVIPKLLRHARDNGLPMSGSLTDREREVLRLLAEGSDTQEIAVGLSFSERTVKNVVHDILLKLNCRTRAHAVATATRSGVI